MSPFVSDEFDLQSLLISPLSPAPPMLEAAIKLGHWSDALQAADDALAIDEEDAVAAWETQHDPRPNSGFKGETHHEMGDFKQRNG